MYLGSLHNISIDNGLGAMLRRARNIEIIEIVQALPGLGHYNSGLQAVPANSNTKSVEQHVFRRSRSCTAGVRLKATYLLTDVGYAEGHHKITTYRVNVGSVEV